MGTLLFVLVFSVALLAAGLAVVYHRLSPLQAFQDERTALFGALRGRDKAEVDEGKALLFSHRMLVKELLEIVRHERATTTTLRAYVNKERDVSQALCAQIDVGRRAVEALCAQLSAERRASEALCDQLDAERSAFEALCEELDVQRLVLLDVFYHLSAPTRVEAAVQAIEKSRALRAEHAKKKLLQGESPAALRGEEQTRREGIPMLPATLGEPRAASTEQERAHEEQPAGRAGEEQPTGERATALPVTPEDIAAQSKLVAATAASEADEDADDTATTQAVTVEDMAAALHAARREETDDDEHTSTWSNDVLTAALEADAGGATRSSPTTPRAFSVGAVAPPASASLLRPAENARKAAGLEREKSTPVAEPPGATKRTRTLAGPLGSLLPPPAEGPLTERRPKLPTTQSGAVNSPPTQPHVGAPRFSKTLSMPVQSAAPTASLSSDTSLPADPEEQRGPLVPGEQDAPPEELAPIPLRAQRFPRAEEEWRRLKSEEETPGRYRAVEHEAGK